MGIGREGDEADASILITAGAGGVGSIASQLAKYWRLRCITTASRPETVEWTRQHGADVVVNHARGIEAEFKEQGLPPVQYTFNAYSDHLLPQLVPVTKPVVGHIVGQSTPLLLQLTTCSVAATGSTTHRALCVPGRYQRRVHGEGAACAMRHVDTPHPVQQRSRSDVHTARRSAAFRPLFRLSLASHLCLALSAILLHWSAYVRQGDVRHRGRDAGRHTGCAERAGGQRRDQVAHV